jgi:membrane-associated phospholipid phosphatase
MIPFRLLDVCFLAPILLCVLCLGLIVATSSNEALFIGANAMAATWLPAFAWAGITNMGSTLGAFCLLSLTLVKWPRWMAAGLLAAPFASLYTHLLKPLLDVPRPPAVLLPETAIHVIGGPLRTGSFPSGHSLTVFTLAGILVFCTRRPVAWLAVLAAMLIAFSRIAVGAHWPLDLFGGAAGGWVSAAIGCEISKRWRFWDSARGQRILAGIALTGAAVFALENTGYPEGVWMQYLLCGLSIAGALYALWRPAAFGTHG